MNLRIRVDGAEHEVVLEKGRVTVDGQAFPAKVEGAGPEFTVALGRRRHVVRLDQAGVAVDGEAFEVHVRTVAPAAAAAHHARGAGPVHPPLPGRVVAVKVKAGEQVQAGQCLVVLEAMKMQNEIPAPVAGTVREVKVQAGQLVEPKDTLLVLG